MSVVAFYALVQAELLALARVTAELRHASALQNDGFVYVWFVVLGAPLRVAMPAANFHRIFRALAAPEDEDRAKRKRVEGLHG